MVIGASSSSVGYTYSNDISGIVSCIGVGFYSPLNDSFSDYQRKESIKKLLVFMNSILTIVSFLPSTLNLSVLVLYSLIFLINVM